MQDLEKEVAAAGGSTVIAFSDPQRPSTSSKHRASTPQIEILKERRDQLRRNHPEVVEAERLRKEIETLERQAIRHEHAAEDGAKLKKVKSTDGVKFFTRPKIRAYFQGARLFKSRGDNEYAATASISLFTDLLFVGVLAETGNLAVVNSETINLLRFIVQFLPSWRIWCYIRDIVAMYEMNAVSQRFLILWILCLLIGFTCKYIHTPVVAADVQYPGFRQFNHVHGHGVLRYRPPFSWTS
jgi:hypothetical protein